MNCTKCNVELDTTGYPLWCKACRAQYKREHEGIRKEMTEGRGFALGVKAMREWLAQNFAEVYASGGNWNGYQIGKIIMQVQKGQSRRRSIRTAP